MLAEPATLVAHPRTRPYTRSMSASSVTVEVPATSANLGSGFDSLGVALDWTLRLRFTVHDDPQPAPADPIALMAGRAALTLYNMAAIPAPSGLEVSVEPDGPPSAEGSGSRQPPAWPA